MTATAVLTGPGRYRGATGRCGRPVEADLPTALQAGTVAAVLAVAALGLPWWGTSLRSVPLDRLARWRATDLFGADLTGGFPAAVLLVLALGALAVAGLARLGRLGRRARGVHAAVLATSGGASFAAAAGLLSDHGAVCGPWVTAVLGLVALGGAAVGVAPRRAAAVQRADERATPVGAEHRVEWAMPVTAEPAPWVEAVAAVVAGPAARATVAPGASGPATLVFRLPGRDPDRRRAARAPQDDPVRIPALLPDPLPDCAPCAA